MTEDNGREGKNAPAKVIYLERRGVLKPEQPVEQGAGAPESPGHICEHCHTVTFNGGVRLDPRVDGLHVVVTDYHAEESVIPWAVVEELLAKRPKDETAPIRVDLEGGDGI